MKILSIVLLLLACAICSYQVAMPPRDFPKIPVRFVKGMFCPEWNWMNIMCYWEAWLEAFWKWWEAIMGGGSGGLFPNMTWPDWGGGGGLPGAVEQLPRLGINRDRVSISGVSSGGYMAVQVHFAYPEVFKRGVGVVAGGPFYCAQGDMMTALGPCMKEGESISVSYLTSIVQQWAAQGLIGSLEAVRASKVYIFHGSLDSVVVPSVGEALRRFYEVFVPQSSTIYKTDLQSEHAYITESYGSACYEKGFPFINNCAFDLAGDILKHLHGPLNPRNDGAPKGKVITFNQSPLNGGGMGMGSYGVADSGFAYIPDVCRESGAKCGVHISLHGCMQNQMFVQDQFANYLGHNKWADTNRLIILYPQTSMMAMNSCWDWFGYESTEYSNRNGPQVIFMKNLIDHLASGN